MKKYIYSVSALVLFSLSSCISDDDTFNNNEQQPYAVPAETLLANAQRELADQATTPEVNLNPLRFYTQYWALTQYPDESRYNLVSRNVSWNLWTNYYRDVLGNLETAKGVVDEEVLTEESAKQNKKAILDILQVYTYQILVDTFGDVPYSESVNPLDVLPAYDDDAAIYPQLITRLDADLALLDETAGSFESGDIMLNGDVARWRQFGNSLKVKLGIAIADVNSTLAQSTIESAVADELILTNADNVTFDYSGAAPFYNPLYAQIVASGRTDYVASASIVDAMNAVNDPRRAVYFKPGPDGITYVGGINGASNNYATFSAPGEIFEDPALPAILFEATEVNFYLAEAAARGYNVGGTAEEYYNAAITTSFEYWGASGVAAYLAQPEVAYTTAEGTWQQKIGTQAWIALYNRATESYNTWRRLDYPMLEPAQNAVNAANGEIPVRLTFPINEQTVNNANWTAASSAIGGDFLYTPVFWDVD